MFKVKSDGQTKFALQTHDKISTKIALQTRQNYRQIYQNSHDEEVDKVRPANTMQLFNEKIVQIRPANATLSIMHVKPIA